MSRLIVDSPVQGSTTSKQSGLWKDVGIVLVVALGLSFLVRTLLVQAFFVPSESMLPTLRPDDRILVSKLAAENTSRGNVVVFSDPGGWLPPTATKSGAASVVRTGLTWVGLLPTDSGDHLVKRLIGVGGDHVVCCDPKGRIELNGAPLTEPYLAAGGTTQVRFDITVPAGRVFVMGDNRGDSQDSRYHLGVASGTVPVSDLVGPVFAVVWPADRWQRITVPETFATVSGAPPAAGNGIVPATTGEAEPGQP